MLQTMASSFISPGAAADHLVVAGGGDEDVHVFDHVLETNDAVALHGGADRIHSRCRRLPQTTQGLGRTLAHIAVADHQSLLGLATITSVARLMLSTTTHDSRRG